MWFNVLLVSEKMENVLLHFKLLFDYSFMRGTSADIASISVKIISSLFTLFSVVFVPHAVKADNFSFSL